MITRAQVQAITGDAGTWFDPLVYAMSGRQITTTERIAPFLAQTAHESQGFKSLTENLHYSAARLLQVFPRYFTPAEAVACAYDEERIAQAIYGSRLGNDPSTDDGYRFRGRGLIQLTGRGNYRAAGKGLGIDLEVLPDLVAQPLYAAQTAAWFWQSRGCNELADAGDFEGITKAINGGLNGLSDRRAWLDRVGKALA